ncbi:MAG: M20/M25/M40 family metallo-hydrolase [Proteobacteria bacterium]|nr:M20/M25/M40 family metallo-hydrolase [Pseudomonadota bacterium]
MRAYPMEGIFDYIRSNEERFIDELASLVRQPSNSTTGEGVEDCASVLKELMEKSGIKTRILSTGGSPVVYGETQGPEKGLTVLIYGHYDVKPPEPLDAWISPPFTPEIRNGRMYGRGAGDDKGQLYAHVKAVESILAVGGRLPVNVKFLFEGEEEIASPNLKPFVSRNRELLRADLMYSSDGTMPFGEKPGINFGVRGILKIEVSSRGPSRDVHSGGYGGLVPNPVWSLIHLLETMKGEDGRVLIEGFYDDIIPATHSEREALGRIGFNEEAFRQELDLQALDKSPGDHPLERLMFWPTLNIQGFFAGTREAEGINIIPARARTIIDMRLVPNQRPEHILEKVKDHCMKQAHLGDFDIIVKTQVPPFRSSLDHPYTPAVIDAVKQGFGEDPLLVPSMGGSDPTYIFGNVLGLPCFKVPYAQSHESNFHAPNENLLLDVYVKAIKTTAALLVSLAKGANTH